MNNSTKSLGTWIRTSPTVVCQLRFIGSPPSCGSSRILATKAATIERPASLRANLERTMKKLLKLFSDRPIGILDWRRLLRHPPAQVAPEEGDQTLDPHLTNKTSAASLAGQVKKLLQPPPTACSQIQPTKGFRKSIHTCDMLLLTSSKKSWKSCPKAMPRTQTRSHMFIFGLAKMLLNELIPLPLNVSVAFYSKIDLSFIKNLLVQNSI